MYQSAKRVLASLSMLAFVLLLSACSTSRYAMKHDKAPEGHFDASQVVDAVPRWEPISAGGNRSPYSVLGKTYHIIPDPRGYVEEGIGSWYGLKFHGELTSNGEIYDMYAMTAAHKTLPIPSYVKVTNLRNQRSVVVRVNDRGPFHDGRVIDLSYAAATRLDYARHGTAPVRVEVITVEPEQKKLPPEADRLAQYVQIAAFSSQNSAQRVQQQLQQKLVDLNVFVAKSPNQNPPVYRVRIGPYEDPGRASMALARARELGIGNPILITRSVHGRDH